MTTKGSLKIALALSGGGVRAAVFHLGVLARLAQDELLEAVTFISTVSGGSMVTGLVYTLSGNGWPSSADFTSVVLPEARYRLTHTSIQRDYAVRCLCKPWLLLQGRAKVVSESMQHCWGMTGLLKDVVREPRWIINATTYESGKNWRFMPQRMGDYVLGYVADPAIPLADAVAASAAFPGLIGPLVLHTSDFSWSHFDDRTPQLKPAAPSMPRLHLWDGGVYDNLGVEALFKPKGTATPFRDEYNFLIISDASASLPVTPSVLLQRPKRLVDIAVDQVRSLRSRSLIDHFAKSPNSGVYLRIGRSTTYLLRQARVVESDIEMAVNECLSEQDAEAAGALRTHLQQLSEQVFDQLFRHGWEVTDCTLRSRCPDLFSHHFWDWASAARWMSSQRRG